MLEWMERHFGKIWLTALIASIVIGLGTTAVAVWAVVSLVNWIISQ